MGGTANCGPEKKVSVRQSREGKTRKGGVNISRISNRSDEYTGQSKDSDQESSKASQEIE